MGEAVVQLRRLLLYGQCLHLLILRLLLRYRVGHLREILRKGFNFFRQIKDLVHLHVGGNDVPSPVQTSFTSPIRLRAQPKRLQSRRGAIIA